MYHNCIHLQLDKAFNYLSFVDVQACKVFWFVQLCSYLYSAGAHPNGSQTMPPGQHHVIPSPRPHSIHPGEQSLSLRSCFKTGSFFEDSAEAPKAKEAKHSKMSALYTILEADAIACMVKLPDFLLFSSMTDNCCLMWQLYIEFFMI